MRNFLYVLFGAFIVFGVGVIVVGVAMNLTGLGTETAFYVFFNDHPAGWAILLGSIGVGVIGVLCVKFSDDIALTLKRVFRFGRSRRARRSRYDAEDEPSVKRDKKSPAKKKKAKCTNIYGVDDDKLDEFLRQAKEKEEIIKRIREIVNDRSSDNTGGTNKTIGGGPADGGPCGRRSEQADD